MRGLFHEYYDLVVGKAVIKLLDYNTAELATKKLDGRIVRFNVTPALFFDPVTLSVSQGSDISKKFKGDKVVVNTNQDVYVLSKEDYESAKASWEKMNVSKGTMQRRDDEEIRGRAERERAMRDQRMIKDAQKAGDIGYKNPF